MGFTLTIQDETTSGKITNEINLSVKTETLTVKDIIVTRVEHEVEAYNNKMPEYFQGLVQPTLAEKTLNGFRMRDRKKVDSEKQTYIALLAFQNNGYFVLIDNVQVESLEQSITIKADTKVSFVKLTPLVGG